MSVPNESGYVPANPGVGNAFTSGAVSNGGSGDGGSLVEFLAGRIDFNGVSGALGNGTPIGNGNSEEDVIHAPSFYDQTLTPSVMMPQQSLADAAGAAFDWLAIGVGPDIDAGHELQAVEIGETADSARRLRLSR